MLEEKSETLVEISFLRRYNLGNYSYKEYQVKIGGTETQVNDQLEVHKEKVIGYLTKLEQIVDIANEANLLKAKLESKPTEQKSE